MNPKPATQSTIVQEGGLTKILEAMVVNASDPEVQAHGCWALCALARRHPSNAKIMVQGLDHAVPQAIKYAIDSNPEHAGLQEKACAALRCLADTSESNAIVLLQEGSVGSLIEAPPTPSQPHRKHRVTKLFSLGLRS